MFKKPEARTGSVGQYRRVLVPETSRGEKPGKSNGKEASAGIYDSFSRQIAAKDRLK
jgi:hypothetical protein